MAGAGIGRGDSPLTDARSLGNSLAFHAALLLLASVAAIGVALPSRTPEARVLRAEVGPVDNRATEEGGGSPGELGGTSLPEEVRLSGEGRSPEGKAARDPADALLADVLPSPTS